MTAVITRDLFGFVHRAGTEQSGAKVLAELSRLIGERLMAHRVTVYVIDGDRLVPLVSEYPSGLADAPRFARWRGASSAVSSEMVVRLRAGEQVLQIRDPEEVLPADLVEAFEVEPFLAVALRTEDALLGALVVEGDPDDLAAQQTEINTLAGVVALVLETARMFGRERERTRETEALLEVGTVLTESTDVKEVLAAVARNSARVCGFERCSILILDGSGSLEPVMSQFADGHTDLELWERFRLIGADLPAAQQVIESGVPAAYREPETVPELIPSMWLDPFGVKSMLLVPLVAWEERFGVLVLDHRDRHSIGPEQVRIAQAVAAQGAAAIGLSRLLEREGDSRFRAEATLRNLRVREAQQAAVAAVSQLALRAPDLATLMDEAVDVLAKTLDVEYAKILELLPGGEGLLLRAGVGWEEGRVGTAVIGAGSDSQAGFTLAASSPVIVEDLATEHRFKGPGLLTDHNVVSGVSVVIGGREKPYGVLGVHTTRPHTFSYEDADFLQSVANVLASAIEQDRGERAVVDSEERLQAILDTASDAIISVDENRKIILFNQHACMTFGYTPEEVLGRPLNMLLPDRARPRHGGHINTFTHEAKAQRLMTERPELAGRRKNGEEFPAEITIARAKLGDQTILTAIVRDVTERNAAQQLIRESEERYRSLFEHSPIAIWEQDFIAVGAWLDGIRAAGVTDLRAHLTAHPEAVDHGIELIDVLSVNPAGLDLIGAKSLDQLLESPTKESHTAGIRESFVNQFLAVWEQRDQVQFEVVGRTAAGDRIDCVLHFAARKSGDRLDLSHVIIALADITERKAAEERLKELVRSKDELIASVSHEIRTPLTAILGFAQLLRSDSISLSESEHSELLQALVNESTDVANIVEDLIVAAKADIGKLQVMRVPVDLRAQVAQVLETWDQGISGNIQLSGETVRCIGDPARVRQVIRNLVSNAVRYGGDNIRVEVGRHQSTGYILLADDGPGVPPEDVELIFENYQRGAQAPGLTAALGLGLGISRHLARVMDGDVTYQHQDGETIFELTLPLAVPADSGADTSGNILTAAGGD